jgi:DNA-binding GntR family transcriptional regulator
MLAAQPTLLPDQVADALISVIFRGELNPGDRIPEEKFAVRLKVSRVPLREAFKQLELLGIVRREPNRGNFVAGASWDEIADIMSVRNVLEGMAVERASLKGLPEDFSIMQTKVDEMKRFAQHQDLTQLVLADIAFHQALWEASKSRVLKRQLTALLMPYFVYIVRVGYAAEKDMAESVVDSHQTLLNLISSRNPNQARGYLMDMTLSYLTRLNGFVAQSGGQAAG